MNLATHVATAREIMLDFATATGITSEQPPQRYLWTDAFAVGNLLALERRTGERQFADLALQLVAQVHRVLGRHRNDDSRTGWISGLGEQEGERHPTAGGLRIGKPLNERGPDEPADEHLEWERDGQYYHYLTKWMHALQQVSEATGEKQYHRWAVELARTAHARFTYSPPPAQLGASSHGAAPAAGRPLRLRWKMSIDLTRSLVAAQGQHDPLDGWITYRRLQAGTTLQSLSLESEIDELERMCRTQSWLTSDPLGIGGLLIDAYRLALLGPQEVRVDPEFLRQLLQASASGMEIYMRGAPWNRPAKTRLAFRELGLSIGLRAIERLQATDAALPIKPELERLQHSLAAADTIESFWLRPENQAAETWQAHRDINRVMLATSLLWGTASVPSP